MAKHVDVKPDKKQPTRKSRWRWLTSVSVWIWTAVVVLAVFEALIANNQALNGQRLAELEKEKTQLSVSVDELESQLAQTGSLQSIRERAAEQLGMEPVSENVWYLSLEATEDE